MRKFVFACVLCLLCTGVNAQNGYDWEIEFLVGRLLNEIGSPINPNYTNNGGGMYYYIMKKGHLLVMNTKDGIVETAGVSHFISLDKTMDMHRRLLGYLIKAGWKNTIIEVGKNLLESADYKCALVLFIDDEGYMRMNAHFSKK